MCTEYQLPPPQYSDILCNERNEKYHKIVIKDQRILKLITLKEEEAQRLSIHKKMSDHLLWTFSILLQSSCVVAFIPLPTLVFICGEWLWEGDEILTISLLLVMQRAWHGFFFRLLQNVQRHHILTDDPICFRLLIEYKYLFKINNFPPQRLLTNCNFWAAYQDIEIKREKEKKCVPLNDSIFKFAKLKVNINRHFIKETCYFSHYNNISGIISTLTWTRSSYSLAASESVFREISPLWRASWIREYSGSWLWGTATISV